MAKKDTERVMVSQEIYVAIKLLYLKSIIVVVKTNKNTKINH